MSLTIVQETVDLGNAICLSVYVPGAVHRSAYVRLKATTVKP
jgi:hypothetical protein